MIAQRCISTAGEAGDCYRACLATILGVPAASIPNFNDITEKEGLAGESAYLAMQQRTREFLHPLGLGIFNTYCNGEWPMEKALDYFSAHSPGVPIIFHGRTPRSPHEFHAVVALDGKIVHDPSGVGISGPCGDWWFMDVVGLAESWTSPRDRDGARNAETACPAPAPNRAAKPGPSGIAQGERS
jgi:hypothetical protein